MIGGAIFAAGLMAAAWGGASFAEGTAAGYRAVTPIPIPDGRWDLLGYDASHNRVFVARGGALTVVDLASGAAHDVGAVAGGHAALPLPGTDTIAVTSGQDNTLRLFNEDSGKQTGTVAVGNKPDAAIWDPVSHRVLVMNADSGTVSVVDPVAMKVTQTIAVKPALELPAKVGPNLLAINNEDESELELVDLAKGKALAPVALRGCEHPTGLAYDPSDHLTLSACANGVAALVDVRTRMVTKLLPIGAGPDGALFDAKRHRFIVPCGRSGTLSVFRVGPGAKVTPLATVKTEVGARTAALDEATGRIFLPSARFKPAEAGKYPQPVPGTAHLLIFALD